MQRPLHARCYFPFSWELLNLPPRIADGCGRSCACDKAERMHRCSYSLPIILTALAGCQTHPQVNAHIDTVNAEYRQLEDYVYCLEDENSQLQQQLDDLRAARVGEPGVQPGAGRGGLFRRRPESIPRAVAAA